MLAQVPNACAVKKNNGRLEIKQIACVHKLELGKADTTEVRLSRIPAKIHKMTSHLIVVCTVKLALAW